MPIISESSYRAPYWLPGGHIQTIHPVLFRQIPAIDGRKEQLELSDGDFLELEWFCNNRRKLAILCHGLEGSSQGKYIRGMALALVKAGWDVLAWNYRGCGEKNNRLPFFYHSGKTDDLEHIVQHALANHPTDKIDLIGFSMGGNLILKYIGERGSAIHPAIHRGVAFSAPCDLACCSAELSKWQNKIYMERFLQTLRKKVIHKHIDFPEQFDIRGIDQIRNFSQFDDRYTAPLHGFKNALDYWAKCSAKMYLDKISIPTLLVNSANDPILGAGCYQGIYIRNF